MISKKFDMIHESIHFYQFCSVRNGLTGEVMSFNSEAVNVYFPSLNRNASIKRHSFTVYDVDKKIDVACRMQFPLRLSFALTMPTA
jgi:hypothetical protein